MIDQDKSKQQLIEELAEMRRRVAAVEKALQENQSAAALLQAAPLGIHECDAISEAKRAEEALRESEERFRQAMEATNDGLWDWNVESGEVYYSPAYSRMLGYEAADFANHVESWTDLLHPDDRAGAVSVNQDCIENRIPNFEVEFRMRTKGGEWKTILGRGKALRRDANGRATRMIGTHVDITDRKRAEEALRESEERFKLFMDNSPAIAWMKDEQGRYVYVNESCARRVGARPEDRIGKTDFELWPSPTAEQFRKNDQKVLSSGQVVEVVEESSKADGNRSYCWNFKFPFQDSTGRRFVGGVGIDITERKRAEEALQKAHDELEQRVTQRIAELAKANEELVLFRKFAEASGQGFGMSDLESRAAYVNPTLCRLLGEERPEDVIGKSIADYYPAAVMEERSNEVAPILEREGHWQGEVTILARHGGLVPTLHDVFLLRDEAGKPIRQCVVVTDITERKRAEEAVAREHRNLRHMLRSSDNERQLIAYEIHDGLAQQLAGAIMQFQTFDHLKDSQPKQAAKAYEAGLTMLRQGHFETRRLIAGVRPPILDEAGVAEAISHLVHEQSRDKGPKIEYHSRVDFDRLDPTLENAIYRIAQEGLMNACKHSKSERISVSLLQREDRVRIEIRDWGVGFDPKALPKDHFGLEGIRQRARLLGGKCNIRSTAGKGARVVVELPVVPRDEEV